MIEAGHLTPPSTEVEQLRPYVELALVGPHLSSLFPASGDQRRASSLRASTKSRPLAVDNSVLFNETLDLCVFVHCSSRLCSLLNLSTLISSTSTILEYCLMFSPMPPMAILEEYVLLVAVKDYCFARDDKLVGITAFQLSHLMALNAKRISAYTLPPRRAPLLGHSSASSSGGSHSLSVSRDRSRGSSLQDSYDQQQQMSESATESDDGERLAEKRTRTQRMVTLAFDDPPPAASAAAQPPAARGRAAPPPAATPSQQQQTRMGVHVWCQLGHCLDINPLGWNILRVLALRQNDPVLRVMSKPLCTANLMH